MYMESDLCQKKNRGKHFKRPQKIFFKGIERNLEQTKKKTKNQEKKLQTKAKTWENFFKWLFPLTSYLVYSPWFLAYASLFLVCAPRLSLSIPGFLFALSKPWFLLACKKKEKNHIFFFWVQIWLYKVRVASIQNEGLKVGFQAKFSK